MNQQVETVMILTIDNMQTFEEFLQEVWTPVGVLDDDMPDAFDNWLSNLDGEEYIRYADKYGKDCYEDAQSNLRKAMIDAESDGQIIPEVVYEIINNLK